MSPYNVFIHCMQKAAYKINIKSQFKEYKNCHRGFFKSIIRKNMKINFWVTEGGQNLNIFY